MAKTLKNKIEIPEEIIVDFANNGVEVTSQLVETLLSHFSSFVRANPAKRSVLGFRTFPREVFTARENVGAAIPSDDLLESITHHDNNYPRAHDFVILGLLKLADVSDDCSLSLISNLICTFNRSNASGVRVIGPLSTLGRFNCSVFFQGSNLELLISAYYEFIRSINITFPGLVFDSVKIMLVSWHYPDCQYSLASLIQNHQVKEYALVLCKLEMPLIENIELVSTNIYEEFRKVYAGQFVVFGGFSWHEFAILYEVDDCSLVEEIGARFRAINKVQDTSTLLLRRCDQHSCSDAAIENEKSGGDRSATSRSYMICTFSRYKKDFFQQLGSLSQDETYLPALSNGSYHVLGHSDHVTFTKSHSLARAFDQTLNREISEGLDPRDTFILIDKEVDEKAESNLKHIEAPLPRCKMSTGGTKNGLLNRQAIFDYPEITASCDVSKILDHFSVQISFFIENVGPLFGVDDRISSVISHIISQYNTGSISEDCALFVLSELRYAIQQRLAGPTVAASGQPLGGMGEQFGGYNTILLACESLFSNCLLFYIKSNILNSEFAEFAIDDDKDIKIPTCLARFDLPSTPLSSLQLYSYASQLNKEVLLGDVPIFLHLPMQKYQPWLWAIELRQLLPWIVHYDIANSRPDSLMTGLNETGLHIPGVFLNPDTLYYLYALKNGDIHFKLDKTGKVTFVSLKSTNVKFHFNTERFRANFWDYTPNGMAELSEYYYYRLQAGLICYDICDSGHNLASFVDAYSRLLPDQAISPKPFSSYVISLYRQHPQFRSSL